MQPPKLGQRIRPIGFAAGMVVGGLIGFVAAGCLFVGLRLILAAYPPDSSSGPGASPAQTTATHQAAARVSKAGPLDRAKASSVDALAKACFGGRRDLFTVLDAQALFNDHERDNTSYDITVYLDIRFQGPYGYLKRTASFACDAEGNVIMPIELPDPGPPWYGALAGRIERRVDPRQRFSLAERVAALARLAAEGAGVPNSRNNVLIQSAFGHRWAYSFDPLTAKTKKVKGTGIKVRVWAASKDGTPPVKTVVDAVFFGERGVRFFLKRRPKGRCDAGGKGWIRVREVVDMPDIRSSLIVDDDKPGMYELEKYAL